MSLARTQQPFDIDHGHYTNDTAPNRVAVLQPARSFLKAEVRIEHYKQGSLVIKDYGCYAGTIWSPLARYLMRREANILQRLKGWAHAPDFLEFRSSHAFAMEYIEGHRVSQAKKLYGLTYFNRLLEVVSKLHGQGIFHNDLRSANIIINNEGRLILIDYGASFACPNWKVLSPLRRTLRILNLTRIVKLKKQISTQPLTSFQRRLLRKKHWFMQVRPLLKKVFFARAKTPQSS